MQVQLLIKTNPAALARASDYKTVFSQSCRFKEEPSKRQTRTLSLSFFCLRSAECWYRSFFFFFCPNEKQKSYRGAPQFHTPSSAQFFHNSELQRRCPTPIYFLCKEDRQERVLLSAVFIFHATSKDISHFLYNFLSLLLHWRWTMETQVMLRYSLQKEQVINWITNTYPIYCSVLLNFLARYLADALLGILTMDSSLP